MKLFLSLSAAAVLLFPTVASAVDEPVGDLAKFQGNWLAKLGPERRLEASINIERNKVRLELTTPDGQKFAINGKLELDEKAMPHGTIDWLEFVAPNGDDLPDNLGIYMFKNKDTIEIMNGGPGKERPTEFKDGEKGRQIITLKRDAKPAKDQKEDVKGDLAKLQGDWTGKVGPENDIPVTMTVKGRSMTFVVNPPDGNEFILRGEITLDESKQPFKTIDWTKITLPDGGAVPDHHGLYRFDGDTTFEVCTNSPADERPTEFKTGAGGEPRIHVYKKKPAAK